VTITTGGKALESGGRGDVIQVEIPGGREKLFAHVSDFRTVTVYAQTPKFAGAQAVEPPK